ncbi:MAG TPA: putative toxin-antitoxin system toxin component, PIN family [Anaerolineales bacterium]|nr:putative toxin-antitoxin system toxin component, PIN family [Anaerolineales bacterium]
MRVAVDMNVLISATIKPNSPLAQILVYIRNGKFEFLYFPEFLKEYAEVVSRPHLWEKYHLDKEEIAAVIQVMENRGVLVYVVTQVDICRDPDDNILLALALDGKADYIVSGDKDLLDLVSFREIPIIKPAEFLAMFE